MSVLLPLTLSNFDDSTQAKFKAAIAAAAGVLSVDVIIDNIESISTARRGQNISAGRRRLLADGIRIDMSIRAADKTAAEAMVTKLTITAINAKLAEFGLPAATILEVPKPETDAAAGGSSMLPAIIGSVAGLAVLLGIALFLYRYRCNARQEQGQPNATAAYMLSEARNQPEGLAGVQLAPADVPAPLYYKQASVAVYKQAPVAAATKQLGPGSVTSRLQENSGFFSRGEKVRYTHTNTHEISNSLCLSLYLHTQDHALSRIHTHTHTEKNVHSHEHVYTHTNAHAHIHTYTHTQTHTHIHTLTLAHTYTHTETHTHPRTHTLTHTPTHTLSLSHTHSL